MLLTSPVLFLFQIVHLKRFQYVNGKWIKSQKVVNFPFHSFDPTAYLASVPRQTVMRHEELKTRKKTPNSVSVAQDVVVVDSEKSEPSTESASVNNNKDFRVPNGDVNHTITTLKRQRVESTSLVNNPVIDGALQDFHQHRLNEGYDPFELKYNLYAIVVSYLLFSMACVCVKKCGCAWMLMRVH